MKLLLLLLLSQSAVHCRDLQGCCLGGVIKGPAAGNWRPAGIGGSSLTIVWIVLCLIMRGVTFQQTEKESLLKAYPGPGCQGAAGGRRLAADREIIQLNSIRVHQ